MREIKFRGKRKHGSEILIGDLLRTCNGGPCIFPSDDSLGLNSPDYFEVDPETIGQFTGLKDKNGKEIFEGDLLWTYEHGVGNLHRLVVFDSGSFCMEHKHTLLCELRGWKTDYLEVIGNIYENPELITT